MLEGKGDNVLDPLKGYRLGVAWKAFADENFDAAKIITRTPMALVEKLTTKGRKLEAFAFARLGIILMFVSMALHLASIPPVILQSV